MNQILQLTIEDIQKVLDNTVTKIKGKVGTGILFLDVSYLYSFDVCDMHYVSKLCNLGKYDVKYSKEWHMNLERWYNDQTVNLPFKPQQVRRNFDRVVNEGLDLVASCLTGGDGSVFQFHAIGEGEDPEALPNDFQLVDELSRIDLFNNADGGSLSREGSTLYFVGNHPDSIASATITETGIFNARAPPDIMLDHSVFDPGINHDQFENSAGSTTVIYMCGV